MHDMKREARARWDCEVCGVMQSGCVFSRVWLPVWLYWALPVACVVAGVVGIYCDAWIIGGMSVLYGSASLSLRYLWRVFAGMAIVVLLAVPTITPQRVITATIRPVVVDMAVVTSRANGGPVKVNVTPIKRSKKKD